jgi:hypothetical protein
MIMKLVPNTRGSLHTLQSSGFFEVVGSPIQRAAGGGAYTYQELANTGLVKSGGGTFALEQKLRPFQSHLQPLALIGERF